MLTTAADIEKHAKLCALHGEVEDCLYEPGTAAHTCWMEAYEAECQLQADNNAVSYEMSLERGYAQDRYSRRS